MLKIEEKWGYGYIKTKKIGNFVITREKTAKLLGRRNIKPKVENAMQFFCAKF
jgi:hypothetical protein